MKTKLILAENYCNKIYQEAVDDLMYAPDVFQSKKDFMAGFDAKEKQIKDKLNALKSAKKELETPKLTKRISTEKIQKLNQQIEILESLI